MKTINTYIYESIMINQIDEDLSFLLDDTVDEGKISDGIKKVWKWVKGKFTGKKSKKKTTDVSSDYTSEIDGEELSYKFYNYGQIKEKILNNNNLTRVNNFITKGYDNKIRLLCVEKKNLVIACAIFVKPENYTNRPSEFSDYADYGYIIKIQIDEDFTNENILKGIVNKIYDELVRNSNCKGLTLNYEEYKANKTDYKKYLEENFDVDTIKDKKIAVFNNK